LRAHLLAIGWLPCLLAGADVQSMPAAKFLRTTNNAAHHLGLPLPSGGVSVYGEHRRERLLAHESGMRDFAGADQPIGRKNGRPIFRLAIPAQSSATPTGRWA
jgi:hypothetical protein